MPLDRSQHTLELATELLEDIELSRQPVSSLVLKASRLARLLDEEKVGEWLYMEMHGYSGSELGRSYMRATGRWINAEENRGFWQGVSEIETQIAAQEALLASLKLPDVSGEMIFPTLRDARTHLQQVSDGIARLAAIRAKVLALLHRFVSSRYYELSFSKQQATLFDQARLQVDSLLAPLSGETLQKVDSIYRRLAEGDEEAISQALTTCRRLIDATADAIYPPTDQTIQMDGNLVTLGPERHKNRLNAHVRDHIESKSRRAKLRRTLDDLYERVSAGVHSDVSADEARFLFLNTYLYLGEVLVLGAQSRAHS